MVDELNFDSSQALTARGDNSWDDGGVEATPDLDVASNVIDFIDLDGSVVLSLAARPRNTVDECLWV